jgi:hypothetical protein
MPRLWDGIVSYKRLAELALGPNLTHAVSFAQSATKRLPMLQCRFFVRALAVECGRSVAMANLNFSLFLASGATNFPFTAGREHFTPIYEQSKYKYLVYVDGHCAACRYGFMMRLGSVILKVAPRQVADRMWYFPLLQPYVDHVPVKADLSDLEEKIRWCREHDDECRQIGENAILFYEKYVARDALLDYVEMTCRNIAKRFVDPPSWWKPPPAEQPPPKLRKPDVPCYEDRGGNNSRLCTRCQEDADAEERELEMALSKRANEQENKTTTRKRLRERMKELAAKKQAS